MPETNSKAAIEILLQTLEQNPQLWETRKKTAEILYEEEKYVEAADILWNAPEIPSTDLDVAFAIKIISRAKPNRVIRMVYEIVRRNHEKPEKNIAVAKALNDIGMYMQASRFYGAALACDSSLFDLGFERQLLWMDDSRRLIKEWQNSDQEFTPPLDVPNQDVPGGALSPSEMPKDTAKLAQQDHENAILSAEQPDVVDITQQPEPVELNPTPMPARRILAPAAMKPTAEELAAALTPKPMQPTALNGVKPSAESPRSAIVIPTQPLEESSAPTPNPDLCQAAAPEEPKKQAVSSPKLITSAPAPSTSLAPTTGKLLTPPVISKPPEN
ncbi:MAG: hypothetical protein ACSHX6_13175 [Akkermansiaceae bacterium]